MVISTNNQAELRDFETILAKSVSLLVKQCEDRPNYFLSRDSAQFEQDVFDVMSISANGGPFDNTIKLVSGLKFPDIVAKRYYGVEVKTSKKNNWTTTGNSVLESTRIENVERIFIFFGKLVTPVGFRYRKYEECLPQVVVTHSPRYLVDMNTIVGETIFDKINISYDELRGMNNPIRPILDYYRRNLKNGEDLWWLDTGKSEPPTRSFIVRLWSTLDPEERSELHIQAMALFPELFGSSSKKYARLATWLASVHSVISPNLRDSFSAGGKVTLKVNAKNHYEIPKVFKHLQDKAKKIAQYVDEFDPDDLERSWGITVTNRQKQWKNLVCTYSKSLLLNTDLDIKEMIAEALRD